jgi:RNA polymerase sigma factor for flagellar operon FliA
VSRGDAPAPGRAGYQTPERPIQSRPAKISRIKGAIIDELRASDWIPLGPVQAREVEKAHVALENRLRRSPTGSASARRS